jgi:hypothetical protein
MITTRTYTGAEIRDALRHLGTNNVKDACLYLDYCDDEAALDHCPVCDGVGHNCYIRDIRR